MKTKNWEWLTVMLHRHRAAVIPFLHRMVRDGTVAENI